MALEFFNGYHSYLDSMEPLGDAERGRLFTACLLYSKTGEVMELRGNERFVFPTMRSQIDRDKAAYEAKCEKNRENGKKSIERTLPNDSERYRTPPNAPQGKGEGKGKGKGKGESIGAAPRFSRPSLEDVAAYCKERGNTVDPQRFVDYYTANGWRVGKQPMKDWRAAVRTWEGREKKSASRIEEIFAEVNGL